MITKAIVKSINRSGNRCVVRMPLFETASSTSPVEIEALVNITPGLFNNLFINDIVFVGFEENALEKPIILGKLYRGTNYENNTPGGAGILDTLKVHTSAAIPASTTLFVHSADTANKYVNLNTPKKVADYILWLERLTKDFVARLDDNFRCFKNWVQWHFLPENVNVDDGDLDADDYAAKYVKNSLNKEDNCTVCGANCTKDKKRKYLKIITNKKYPNI